jgi:hypothetical protein
VLAAPIRVDPGVEPDIGALVVGDDGLRGVLQEFGFSRAFLLLGIEVFELGLVGEFFEPAGGIGLGASSARGGMFGVHGMVLF